MRPRDRSDAGPTGECSARSPNDVFGALLPRVDRLKTGVYILSRRTRLGYAFQELGVGKLGFNQVVAGNAVHVIPVIAHTGVTESDAQRHPIAQVAALTPPDVSVELLGTAGRGPADAWDRKHAAVLVAAADELHDPIVVGRDGVFENAAQGNRPGMKMGVEMALLATGHEHRFRVALPESRLHDETGQFTGEFQRLVVTTLSVPARQSLHLMPLVSGHSPLTTLVLVEGLVGAAPA